MNDTYWMGYNDAMFKIKQVLETYLEEVEGSFVYDEVNQVKDDNKGS